MPQAPDCLELDLAADSNVCLSFAPDSCFTVWAVRDHSHDTEREMRLSIAPHRPIVIGRAEGHDVPWFPGPGSVSSGRTGRIGTRMSVAATSCCGPIRMASCW